MTTTSAFTCKRICDANSNCTSWTFVEATGKCFPNTDAYVNNIYAPGVSSGLPSRWVVDEAKKCLIMERRGSFPASGTLALCAAFEAESGEDSDDFTFGYGAADDAHSLF